MTCLNERFLTYLEEHHSARDPRPRRALIALAMGALLLTTTLFLLDAWGRLASIPGLVVGAWLLGNAIYLFFQTVRDRQRAQRLWQIGAGGQRITAYLIQADDALYRPGSQERACQVLVSFQPEVAGDREYMQYLVRRWADQLPLNTRYVRNRRTRLPLSLTDGSVVYCCDLFLHPNLLPAGYLTGTVLPCLAEDGPQGGIELIPYWLLFPYVDSPTSEEQHV